MRGQCQVVSEWKVVCEGPVSEWRGGECWSGQWGVRGQCRSEKVDELLCFADAN